MNRKPVYSAAIVGLGRIGVTLEEDPLRVKPCSHAGAYGSHPRVRLVAGCDTDRAKREHFRRRWKTRSVYADYRELLERGQIDILSVATWTDSHARIVTDAAATGRIRAILCEKPVALTVPDAEAMIRSCRKAKCLLVVNHERRFEDRYRLVKRLVGTGRIGEIRTIVGNVLTNVPQKQKSFDINATSLLHDGTHLIDIIHYIAGPAAWVEGFVSDRHREAVTAVMRLKSGASVFIETGGMREYFNFELDIQGTEGRILIGNTHLKFYRKRKSRHYAGFQELAEVALPAYKKSRYFTDEVDAIVGWLDGRRSAVESTGEDGLAALRVIEAVFRSGRQDGRRLRL
jgi:predicted dehydrogenase